MARKPAFAWWVRDVIKKRAAIISKVKSKYWQHTHKFGICIAKSVDEAIKLDKENGNTLWWDAIYKEMKNVWIAFEEFEGGQAAIPPGYQEIKYHMNLMSSWVRTTAEKPAW